MKLKDAEIKLIKTNLDILSEIEWTTQNDEKLNELFFGISDIFEKKLKWNNKIKGWRKIEICFQHRALTDTENEYPKTKKQCISMIDNFFKKFTKNEKII